MKRFFLILLFVVLASFIVREAWLPYVAKWLVVYEDAKPADLIIVLNGHNTKKRLDRAVWLYQKRYAPQILVSGSWQLEEETDINLGKEYLRRRDVPDDAIQIENKSASTYENAIYAAEFLKKGNYDSFVLVTSPAHSRRAWLLFHKVIPSYIRWTCSPDPEDFNYQSWWKDIETAREVFYEYLTLLLSLGGKSD